MAKTDYRTDRDRVTGDPRAGVRPAGITHYSGNRRSIR